MKFLSLEPFVPSGPGFESSKQFFQEVGFSVSWDAVNYVGFDKDGCKFILQKCNNKEFAQNLMISIKVDNANDFWQLVTDKKLGEKYGIKIGKPTRQPYGIEVNIIDMAGVCWHFVE